MNKLVIIGANESNNKLILRAKELSYETHVFAWQIGDVGELTADHFYPISIDNKDEILEICKRIKPVGVISITSDFAVGTVNYVARNLGLVANSSFTDIASRNKFHMREAFRTNGLKVPWYRLISNIEELSDCDYQFPLIVKPTDRWSSKGVTKVNNLEELTEAVANAIELSIEKKAIVEEFIHGTEYSAECLSYNGNHTVLTLTKKFTTGSPSYIEIGHMQPVELEKNKLKKIDTEIKNALDALQIKYGASHVEFKVNDDGVFGIIEIGSRMGGDCIGTDLVQLSTGHDYIKMVIEIAAGQRPVLEKSAKREIAIVRFILNKDDMEIYNVIKRKYPSYLKFTSNLMDMNYRIVTDSSNRLGYFLISADPTDINAIKDIKKICNIEGDRIG